MHQAIHQHDLDNGMRLVMERIPGALSVSLGIWIEAGARHESRDEMGISHFTEHLLFKGTKRRSAREIALALESVGGYLDAYTGREHTCYYAHFLPEHLPRALDVLSDMLRNPLFRADHVEREREVVLDEIKTFEDTPDELIHDLFASELWRGRPLGHQILGTPRSVREFRPARVRGYFERRYTADRMIVALAGAIEPRAARALVERRLRVAISREARASRAAHSAAAPEARRSSARDGRARRASAAALPAAARLGGLVSPNVPRTRVLKRRLSQEYICVGGEGVPVGSRDRLAVVLLASILGGGMSSRLFQRVREERGLAYSVYTYTDSYADSGIFCTSAATVPARAPAVVRLIASEYRRLLRHGISARELLDAKRQLRGEIIFSLESVSSRMRMLAAPLLYGLPHRSVDEVLTEIDRARRDDVMRVAQRLLAPAHQTLVAMGPSPARSLASLVGE
ncbi:MAG: M16 family metallopeptidase [bacterium]